MESRSVYVIITINLAFVVRLERRTRDVSSFWCFRREDSYRKRKREKEKHLLVYVRRKSKRTFRQTDGGYLAKPGTLLEEDQASQAWRSALRYSPPSFGIKRGRLNGRLGFILHCLLSKFCASPVSVVAAGASALAVYSSMSLVKSNLGFFRTLTLRMSTFSRGKILEHSL